MPATVVVVHDDNSFTTEARTALEQKGFDVATFDDPLAALVALENARSADLLITRVEFGAGKPHGVSLALMARNKRPHITVLFVARPEHRPHTDGIGELLPVPASTEDLVAAAERLLKGGRAAPLLMTPQAIRRERPHAAAPPVVCFSWRTTRLIRLASQVRKGARAAIERAQRAWRSRAPYAAYATASGAQPCASHAMSGRASRISR